MVDVSYHFLPTTAGPLHIPDLFGWILPFTTPRKGDSSFPCEPHLTQCGKEMVHKALVCSAPIPIGCLTLPMCFFQKRWRIQPVLKGMDKIWNGPFWKATIPHSQFWQFLHICQMAVSKNPAPVSKRKHVLNSFSFSWRSNPRFQCAFLPRHAGPKASNKTLA